MSEFACSTAAELYAALGAAKSGDIILLAPGDYGNVGLKNLTFEGTVTIASRDPNAPAVFTGMTIANSQGLSLQNVELNFATPVSSWNAQVLASRNIELGGLRVHGDLAGSVATAPAGLLIRDSSGVKVTGGEFQHLEKAMFLLNSTNVELSGNAIHHIRSDGVDSAGTSNVQIIGNTFTDFFPAAGDHPDAIQFMTVGTVSATHDVLISGNYIGRGMGGIIQGIFVTDQAGVSYQRVTITDNVVVGAMYNGILVDSATDVTVSGNTVAAYSDMASYIRLGNISQLTVANNEVMKFIYSNLSGLTESGNQLIGYLTGNGENALANKILGTAGADALEARAIAGSWIEGGDGDDVLKGQGGADRLRGGDGRDALFGGDGNDDLHGNAGDDTVAGGGGDDWVVGGKGADLLTGDAGADLMYGNLGADTMEGGVGADTLRGGQQDDLLSGGDGDDWLAGDLGSDTISGGAGADTFYAWSDSGLDVITDFNRADGDRLLLATGSTYTVAQNGGDAVVSIGGAAQVVLIGVNVSSLADGWIAFG